MNLDPLRRPFLLTLPPLLCLLAACAGPGPEDVDPAPPPGGGGDAREPWPELPEPPPWTDTFRTPGLIIADEIRVEGPKGLLDHFAARVEPDHHSYTAETVPEGFLQTIELKRHGSGVEIRAQLDATELVALEKLVALERPGDVDVVVYARGDAYSCETATGAERRGPALTFRGE